MARSPQQWQSQVLPWQQYPYHITVQQPVATALLTVRRISPVKGWPTATNTPQTPVAAQPFHLKNHHHSPARTVYCRHATNQRLPADYILISLPKVRPGLKVLLPPAAT